MSAEPDRTPFEPLAEADRKVFAYLAEVSTENMELRFKVERQDHWLDRIEAMHKTWSSIGGDAEKAEAATLAVWQEMKDLLEARARWEGEE